MAEEEEHEVDGVKPQLVGHGVKPEETAEQKVEQEQREQHQSAVVVGGRQLGRPGHFVKHGEARKFCLKGFNIMRTQIKSILWLLVSLLLECYMLARQSTSGPITIKEISIRNPLE